ncbi:hypothetical protein [Angustibacter sp. Root456]|uniref:hypothetical protein n=1 Tax=Angustibacter sp. Root456 TaxID=1736539 RepID=UPI0012F80494|nr:hypothetical protein [Angustibacter sp. Root456]
MPAPAAHAATTTASPTRPLWVWGKDDPQRVVDFAVAHGVDDLYVHVTPTVLTDGDLPRLRALAQLAQAAGLTLSALGGDPAWTNRPADALAWQQAALSTGLFRAAHVDVEPYALAGWSTPRKRAALAAKYVDLLTRLQSADPRPLEADVPFWYGTIASPTGHGTLADDVLARVDAVTVMSYRDSAAAMVDVGRDVLQRADRLAATTGRRVPVHLAAETNPLTDCAYCTFAEEGDAALRQALDAVDVAAGAYATYAGTAVHDLTGWSLLRP